MAHFYFDSSDNGTTVTDHDGVEFPNLREAVDEAVRALGAIGRESFSAKHMPKTLHMTVLDADRAPLVRLSLQLTAQSLDDSGSTS